MINQNHALPREIACQIKFDKLRTVENKLFSYDVHADIFLEDYHLVRDLPMSIWTAISSRFNEHSVIPSVHLPFYGLNLGSRNKLIKEISFNCISQGLEIAGALGASIAVMHTGFVPVITGKARRKWLEAFFFDFCRLKKHAENLKVRLLLENTWETDPEIFGEMEKLAGERLDYCLDFGHVNVFSNASSGDWIKFMQDRIFAIHVHDNPGDNDSHLPLGEGNIDFSPILDVRNTEGLPRIIIEHKLNFLPQSLKYLNNLFRPAQSR